MAFQLGAKPGQSVLEPNLPSPMGSVRFTFVIHMRTLILTWPRWLGWMNVKLCSVNRWILDSKVPPGRSVEDPPTVKDKCLPPIVDNWKLIEVWRQVGPWKNPPFVRDEGSLFPLIRLKTHSLQIISDYSRKVYILGILKLLLCLKKLGHINWTKLWKGGTRRLTLGTCQIQVIYQMHHTFVLTSLILQLTS